MLITLTTDFGTRDPYVGIMKGVIARIAPAARVIDITHDIHPQHLIEAALTLESLIDYFPDGTIHVAVIDPTVGSDRAAVAVQTERCLFIGPDNGLFTAALARSPMRAAVALTHTAYHLTPVSATFHGRDIFAPVAAHLANGTPLAQLGDPIDKLATLHLPQPVVESHAIHAHVLHIDRFGNLITNLTHDRFNAWHRLACGQIVIHINHHTIDRLSATYADVPEGALLAYFGSSGRLEVAQRNGSAAAHLQASTDTLIMLERPSPVEP